MSFSAPVGALCALCDFHPRIFSLCKLVRNLQFVEFSIALLITGRSQTESSLHQKLWRCRQKCHQSSRKFFDNIKRWLYHLTQRLCRNSWISYSESEVSNLEEQLADHEKWNWRLWSSDKAHSRYQVNAEAFRAANKMSSWAGENKNC